MPLKFTVFTAFTAFVAFRVFLAEGVGVSFDVSSSEARPGVASEVNGSISTITAGQVS
jgi:hypothetical protein